MVMISIFGLIGMTVSCCKQDNGDNIVPNENKIITDAGNFKIENLTRKRVLSEDKCSVYVDDTLHVVFEPKAEYSSFKFLITCESEFLKQVNESNYVVVKASKGTTVTVGEAETIRLSASCEQKVGESMYNLSAKKNYPIHCNDVPVVDVNFEYFISEDLLLFVNPSIEYQVNGGDRVTLESSGDYSEDEETLTIYKSVDGKIRNVLNFWSFFEPNGEWKKTDEFTCYMTSYPFSMKDVKKYSSMAVKYIANNNYNLEKDYYLFARCIYYNSRHGHNDFVYVNRVPKEKVETYIKNLTSDIDVIGFYLDNDYRIVEKISND